MSDAPPLPTPIYMPGDPDPLRDGLWRGYYTHTLSAVLPKGRPA